MSSMSVNITKKIKNLKHFFFVSLLLPSKCQRAKVSQFFIKNPFVKEAPIQ